MPPVSEAQRKWAWANANKGGSEGKAAREFAKADPGGKLPKYAPSNKNHRNSGHKGAHKLGKR